MGLSHIIARLAVHAAKVLIVESPGQWRIRISLEQCMLERGWRRAWSPADADILATCGDPGSEFAEIVKNLWAEMPGPRVQMHLTSQSDIPSALDHAAARLVDVQYQQQDAEQRADQPVLTDSNDDAENGHDHDALGHDHREMEHGQHHDHAAMTVKGLPLAQGGEDRDGLEMDELQVPLGPVLPCWPAGLVLECTMHGDVIVAAEAFILGQDQQAQTGKPQPALRCDGVMDLLELAGASNLAVRARRVRDAILHNDWHTARDGLEKLRRRITSSRMLGWSLAGVLEISQADQNRYDLPQSTRGDAYDRLRAAMVMAEQEITGQTVASGDQLSVPWPTVANLIVGSELATARLAVASLNLVALRAS